MSYFVCFTILLDFTATFTCDNTMEMFADGRSLGKDNGNWGIAVTYSVPGDTRVISVAGQDWAVPFGVLGSFSNGLVTNESWRCSSTLSPGWNSPDFDDQQWPFAVVVGNHGDSPWGFISGIASKAKWIWTSGQYSDVYCRVNLR